MDTINSLDLAKHVLKFRNLDNKIEFTHLKLQKTLFYIEAFHLAMLDKPLIKENFEAWDYGPVLPLVYHSYKQYGGDTIPAIEEEPLPSSLNQDTLWVISCVMEVYGNLSGIALMQKTHSEAPWRDAYTPNVSNIIKKEDMKTFYKKMLVNE